MNTDGDHEWLATCARGIGPLLVSELTSLGAGEVRESADGVRFTGPRAVLYRACLWSRLASRILLPLDEGSAADADELYATLRAIPWHQVLGARAVIAVDFHGTNAALRDTRFGAQRSKDGISDALREAGLGRPKIDPRGALLRVSVRLRDARASVALDLVGESLHRRGYRKAAGGAPLKEQLAAALLMRAGWPEMAAEGRALLDPMCGSATLLIEAALMAGDRAPALNRERFGFQGWGRHDEVQWQALRADARARAERGLANLPEIRGYDGDPRVVRQAQENIAAAGLGKGVRVSVKALHEVKRPTHTSLPEGLLICNPPYGERLGTAASLGPLYRRLGELMHGEFPGWQAAVLVADREHGKATGLRSHRQYAFLNGRIPVELLLFDLSDNTLADQPVAVAETGSPSTEKARAELSLDPDSGAQMFLNRLRKNQRRLEKWLRRESVSCYRLYDADMPEYSVVVDRYGDWLHVSEYAAPKSVDASAAATRLADVMRVLPAATGVPAERIVLKSRQRQRGADQYGRQAQKAQLLSVEEGPLRFFVNLHDYLDTGLFLDHRALRRSIATEVRGKRFLNLFCYTGSVTVWAAHGGAHHCTSVDLSTTYLDWLRRNLAHNGFAESKHDFVRADCLAWLRETSTTFDVIFLDPPSFSNSKRMGQTLDVQRDHPALVDAAMGRLAEGGVLYFSTNRRRFKLDSGVEARYRVADVTEQTLDPDFPRRPPAHHCWRITAAEGM